MKRNFNLTRENEYKKYIGAEKIEKLHQKAKKLKGRKMAHVNSTY
jgi:hypothetical protein